MIEFLFLDLDDTIFDFQKAEQVTIEKTLRHFGVEPTAETVAMYSRINKNHWEMLERGEITREQLKIQRFAVLFARLGVAVCAKACSDYYVGQLAIGHYFLPGAREAVEQLSKKYRLFLASNGNASVQTGRLNSANLWPYFEQVFISEEIGANKPSKAYFDRCFDRIPGLDKGKTMIVGDSLTSDILGGKQAGIATCWVNPAHKPRNPEILPDHEIEALPQLEALLESL